MFLWGNFSARDRLAKVSENMNSVKFEQQMLAFFFFLWKKLPVASLSMLRCTPKSLDTFI